ncbi:MAG: basic amino acid ABC transporter substrate-binding protein [Firmicutes bacterium]|nr:basic amino acid ABC transporter substrate-binding protein [Bacillota bacterium]
MQRRLSLLFAALLALSALVAGCGQAPAGSGAQAGSSGSGGAGGSAASATPTLDRIKREGVLKIGTSPDYPPFEFLDENNQVVGFDIDIMQEVAKELGVQLEIVQMGFDGLIPALQAGKFDIMAAGVTVTEERKQAVDFTDPYLAGTDAIVVRKDWDKPVKSLEDLKGHRVAVQIGTVHGEAVRQIEGVEVKEYNLFTEAATAVASGQADATYLHKVVAEAFIKANPNLKIAAELPALETAFALRKDTPDLTQFVNQVLAKMKQDGRFDRLTEKWFMPQ